MKESLIKLRYKIDKLTMRERMIILTTVILFLLVFWFLLVYSSQKSGMFLMEINTNREKADAALFIQKRKGIEDLATDNTVAKLVAKYDALKVEMAQLDKKIQRYDQRFISENELAKLLYSMLEKTEGVRIDGFSNTAYTQGKGTETIEEPAAASSEPKSTTTAVTHIVATSVAGIQQPELPTERMQYKLTLHGDYFSIMAYLRRLEHLQWQLYWDKLDYVVGVYPQATAVVEFYTLRPVSDTPKITKGATP